MDNRPIGVFDSGVGGLYVLKQLVSQFPGEDFIYLSDSKNIPYGSKTQSFLQGRVDECLDYLVLNNVKIIVVACNTISMLLRSVDFFKGIKLIKLNPQILSQKHVGEQGAFFGTPFSVNAVISGQVFNPQLDIEYFALPGLAREVELLLQKKQNEVFLDHHMTTVKHYDFIYLGCTHYLHLINQFSALFTPKFIYDGTHNLSQNLLYYLEKCNLFAQNIQSISFIGDEPRQNQEIYNELRLKQYI